MKYIASWSGGKDSTASIILAHIYNEPLDEIVFNEVMFDETTSGEYPEQMAFIKRAAEVFRNWGYNVTLLQSTNTFKDKFYSVVKRSKVPERNGKISGFPMSGGCFINSGCKLPPLRAFKRQFKDAIYYIGIAADELNRLERLGPDKISLLAKYNYTEDDAFKLCSQFNLLSPMYNISRRGGCWFCPSASLNEMRFLYKNHRALWNKLMQYEDIAGERAVGYCWKTQAKLSLHSLQERFVKEGIK